MEQTPTESKASDGAGKKQKAPYLRKVLPVFKYKLRLVFSATSGAITATEST